MKWFFFVVEQNAFAHLTVPHNGCSHNLYARHDNKILLEIILIIQTNSCERKYRAPIFKNIIFQLLPCDRKSI